MSKPSEKVFKILKGFGFPVKIYDETGNVTVDPLEGTRFFVEDPNLMVTVENNEIRLNKSSGVQLADIEQLTQQLKNVTREFMMRYSLKVYGKSIAPKDFSFEAKIKKTRNKTMENKSNVTESLLGKLFGRTKTSYQTLGEVKLIYKHKAAVNENSPSSRIRNIKSITLEHNGLKYAYPCVHVDGARAMARHLSEGGLFADLAGLQIQETSQKHKKLVEFAKYAKRNKLIGESNETVYRLIEKKIASIKSELREFASSKDYGSQRNKFESIRLAELQNDRVSQLRDEFTVKSFDAQLEDILPVINNILQEKEDYERNLLEEIGKGLQMSRTFAIPEALVFETPYAKFAYYLEETANCLESEVVSAFMKQLSEKLTSGEDLEDFEIDALKEAFSKIKRGTSTVMEQPKSVMDAYKDDIDAIVEAPRDHDGDYEAYLDAQDLGYKGHPSGARGFMADYDLDARAERMRSAKTPERPKVAFKMEVGEAPNGQPYNGIETATVSTKDKALSQIHSFHRVHYGAKAMVDAKIEQNEDSSYTLTIYFVDTNAADAPLKGTYKGQDPFELINHLKSTTESVITEEGMSKEIKELEAELGRPLTPDELELFMDDDEEQDNIITMPGNYGRQDNDSEF